MNLRGILIVLTTAISLLWPAFINGGAFWFPDTSSYIRAADAATVFVTGSPSEWSDRLTAEPTQSSAPEVNSLNLASERGALRPTRMILKGRSIYYGFLIYLPMRIFGPWAAIALQSLLVATLLIFCGSIALRELPQNRRFWPFFGLAALVLATPCPFYVCMLMPDIYSGVLVLTLATLLAFWRGLSRLERTLMGLACGIMASFHTTILLLALALGVFGVLLSFRARVTWQAATIPFLTLGIALIGNFAFNIAVEHALHRQPISPPFLSARLTADGPGTTYLRRTCPLNPHRWELCKYLTTLPQPSDNFLWSERKGEGVFQIATADEQRRIAEEDKRFALAVLKYKPIAVIATSLRGTLEALLRFNLVNFNYPDRVVANLAARYPANIAADVARSRAAASTMPTLLTVIATIITSLGGLLVFCRLLWRSPMDRRFVSDEIPILCLLILVAILANAAICGALSTAHARYQMRLIWLLPFAGAILIAMRKEAPVREAAQVD